MSADLHPARRARELDPAHAWRTAALPSLERFVPEVPGRGAVA